MYIINKMAIKYPECCRCGKVCKQVYHFIFKLCGRCNIIKNREERDAKKFKHPQ